MTDKPNDSHDEEADDIYRRATAIIDAEWRAAGVSDEELRRSRVAARALASGSLGPAFRARCEALRDEACRRLADGSDSPGGDAWRELLSLVADAEAALAAALSVLRKSDETVRDVPPSWARRLEAAKRADWEAALGIAADVQVALEAACATLRASCEAPRDALPPSLDDEHEAATREPSERAENMRDLVDRRASPRVPLTLPCVVHSQVGDVRAHIVAISVGGVCLAIEEPLPENEDTVTLHIGAIDDDGEPLTIEGCRVTRRHSQHGEDAQARFRYGCAVKFPEPQEKLAALLQAIA